jgi:acyl carrier protein
MAPHDILTRLSILVSEVLDTEDIKITPNTSAEDVDGWDSLAHVRIIIAIEEEFGVRFTTHEVAALKTVRGIVELVENKL